MSWLNAGRREGQMAGRSPYMQAVNFGQREPDREDCFLVITQAKQKSCRRV